MNEQPPFLVLAMPRSRSYWLSRLLTYGDWYCGHDELRRMRSLDDARRWLSQPNTGSVETAAAPFWRLIRHYRPDVRVVVLRRDPADAVASWFRAGGNGEPETMLALFRRLDRKLEQAADRLDAPTVRFEDLARGTVCRRLFKYFTHTDLPTDHWLDLAHQNLQISVSALLRYVEAYREPLTKFGGHARHKSFELLAGRAVKPTDGVTFQREAFDPWFEDARPLFERHMIQTDQAIEDYARKNLPLLREMNARGLLEITTARSNGRMFGYLVTVIAPSLDDPAVISAQHLPIFADPSMPGLGAKLLRAVNADLAQRGIGEIYLKAGHRGSGPRLGKLFERIGAAPIGELYRLDLRAA